MIDTLIFLKTWEDAQSVYERQLFDQYYWQFMHQFLSAIGQILDFVCYYRSINANYGS